MSRICQITGKRSRVGNNVSHSMRRTKRMFNVNLFTKKFYYVEEDCWIVLKVSAAGLRIINRIGLDAALKQAVAKGYCDWKDIRARVCFTPFKSIKVIGLNEKVAIMGVLDRKGTLQADKDADILVLDDKLDVRCVWQMGKVIENTLF